VESHTIPHGDCYCSINSSPPFTAVFRGDIAPDPQRQCWVGLPRHSAGATKDERRELNHKVKLRSMVGFLFARIMAKPAQIDNLASNEQLHC
jgi:hypothetical protein